MSYQSLRHLDEGNRHGVKPRNTLPVQLAERKRRLAMQRITTKVLFVLAVVTMVGGIAWAASVHFKHGSPTAFDNGLTLTMSGVLSGLGNGNIQVTLNATADPDATCTNQGGNQAPGQNPAEVAVTGSVAIPNSQIKNGNVAFTVTTNAPSQPTADDAGCPSDNWTAQITDMHFTSATLSVVQNNVTVLGPVAFPISPPSSNGPIPGIP